jgi:hypothetical protein
MNVKRSVVALAAAGGTAALVFGGSAASTAFTSSSSQTATAKGASTGVTVDNGSFTVDGLVPGAAPTSAGTVTVTNSGNTPSVLTVSFGAAVINHNGTGGAPQLSELNLTVAGHTVTANQIAGQTFSLGTVPAGTPFSAQVSVGLASGTGNDWNGASVSLPYTVTMTAGN